jgi:hypothetical protein
VPAALLVTATGTLCAAASAASATSVVKPASKIRHFSLAEVVQCRKVGQCFHCDEFFTQGHKLVCKQLFCNEVVDRANSAAPPADATNPTISIRMLKVIRPRSRKTMQLLVVINGAHLTTPIFWVYSQRNPAHLVINVDLETAAHAGIQFGAHSGLQVVVAIGDLNQSPGCCCNMSLSISSEQFVLDCYDLTLSSYDMVLAVQDLEALADLHALIEGVCNGDKGQH